MIISQRAGQVITFYSFKGGTGRSMALANLAVLLAKNLTGQHRVLMMDWDLEAPGLHRFFQDQLRPITDKGRDATQVVDERLGLIDLFLELDSSLRGSSCREEDAHRLLSQIDLDRYILQTRVPGLHLLKAGRFDSCYISRVSSFQWDAFYERTPWLIPAFANYLTARYPYVFIDSRTGVGDASGICTALMPEKLVAVFTPNLQSLLGLDETLRRVTQYRRQSPDLRPLMIFPLPSRIEPTRPTLQELWRHGNMKKGIVGYQPLFERLFTEVYELEDCDLGAYFDEVQIQHVADYAYGEHIVALEKQVSRLSLNKSYDVFLRCLCNLDSPWSPLDRALSTSLSVVHQQTTSAVLDRKRARGEFDVYIAYAHSDYPAVSPIVEQLEDHGLLPWLDRNEVNPGEVWLNAVSVGLRASKTVAFFIGSHASAAMERSFPEHSASTIENLELPIIPVLLPGADARTLPAFLRYRRAVDFREDPAEALKQLIQGITRHVKAGTPNERD